VIGGKWEFKPDKNPGPGHYDTTRADKLIKPRSPSPNLDVRGKR